MDTTQNLKNDIAALRAHIDGATLSGDEVVDERAGAQVLRPHRPTVVVEVASVEDVACAVTFATGHRMPVAVQATGHGRASALDDGLLIDTGCMRDVTVDPAARRAWVPAGARWQDVIDRSTPHGLAPLSGSLPSVGAVSYTLGGGVGLLARRYGFSADHVTRLEVVTPDGRLRSVSPHTESELFWALRGGGGNFGVVTGMEIDLMPVARLYGGSLMFDLAEVPEVLAMWTRWTRSVPDDMTSAVSVIPFPDLLAIPAHLRGRQVAQLQFSFAGPAEEGRALVEPLLDAGPRLQESLRDMSYAESGAVFDEPERPAPYRGRSVLVSELDPVALTALATRAGTALGGCIVGVRHLGGALSRAPKTPNAVGHRAAQYSVGVLSMIDDGNPALASDAHDELLAPFAPYVCGHSLNFAFGPLEPDQVRSAFAPADADRLGQLRERHDPEGILHPNHPIPQ